MQTKKHFLRWLFLLVCLFSAYIVFAPSTLDDKFNGIKEGSLGVVASSPQLDELMPLFQSPPVSATGKSLLTINKMGFDVLDNDQSKKNWLLDELSQFTKKNTGTLLDVGCGYGTLALGALSEGWTVIANDIAAEHLIEVRRRCMKKQLPLNNLYLNTRVFPLTLDFEDNTLDAVVLHRVIHFMQPADIEEGFTKIHRWLKLGGKVFIVVMAPHHKGFSSWFLPIYEERWKAGEKWPGANLDTQRALPDQFYNLPRYLNVMDDRPLRRALKEKGFTVERADFIDMKHFAKAGENRDGHEAIGVIAIKG